VRPMAAWSRSSLTTTSHRPPSLVAGLAVGLLSLGLTACDQCREEEIPVVTMAATIDFEGQTTMAQLEGSVGPFNIDEVSFRAVRDFLAEGGAQGSGGAVWTVEPQSASPALSYVAIQLSGPLAPGDLVNVTTAFDGGGWGTPFTSVPMIAVASPGGFVASTASGTLEVLNVQPLGLRLDMLTVNAEMNELRLRGDMAARLRRESFCD
jgi:hypothetical protein